MEITLADAMFSNYQFCARGGKKPQETFDLTFTAIGKQLKIKNYHH
jgi:type VI protein secretion system component Hcp